MLIFILSLLISSVFSWPTFSGGFRRSLSQKTLQYNEDATPGTHTDSGWSDPSETGGRMLDWATLRYGEPLNVIISADSDPNILTLEGLKLYANSLGYAEECLGLHAGRLHQADLGDGEGPKDQEYLARQAYFPILGTCWQSLVGGHHFRAWQQTTTKAWFLGVSKELDSGRNHKIAPNGYNLGRDWLVERAIAGTSWKGNYWTAEVDFHDDLLEPGHKYINHNISQDGVTAILTVYAI
ncbi:hypothetical protein Clacol_010208 [Clathrus columnatus]|uniref:Uncharacterized protein n=1 Tax=Clathrus columnatus TaxID=1419009 RepID=A0AAV5AMT9_9AGAM|nr:hypothetical protein Clacol_010208 [Clathrus columnatus]